MEQTKGNNDEKNIAKQIGKNIKELRINFKRNNKKKYKQEEIARALDIETITYKRLEEGSFKKLDLKYIEKLCSMFNTSILKLFKDTSLVLEHGEKRY